ncbi:MAG: ATP-binding protein [Proteobacteria bacterium]|nr:ATP-binding protein [Pseudomonadota bacterium]
MGRRSISWRNRVGILAFAYAVVAIVAAIATQMETSRPWLALLAGVIILVFMLVHLHRLNARVQSLYRALAGSVDSFRDGDFSFGLAWPHRDEVSELVAAHNQLGQTVREQRQALVQRELLLDTVVQNTPVSIVLIDATKRIVLGNLAARKLLGDGRRLEGRSFDDLIADTPPALRNAIAQNGDALFALGDDEDDDIIHLSRRRFRLNGRPHELFLLRQLTAELRRQEVQTWKKVIRVISHELNNSLAPIASLAHSAGEMLRIGRTERLPDALRVIEERARHLEEFIRGYARFAKLPAPRREAVSCGDMLRGLQEQFGFRWDGMHRDGFLMADRIQLEQALLNLLKNAHEAGGADDEVALDLRRLPAGWRLDVLDRGKGMSETVIAQALLPFYSTKRNGTGLGLALAREIAEAHGGSLSLANREGGGLMVSLTLSD